MAELSGRVLNDASIKVLSEEIDGAKSRGWSQGDLRRWFSARGVSVSDYKAALDGSSVPDEVASTFAQITVTGMPLRPFEPNREDIRRHIEWLISPARGDYDDALFEIAYDAGTGSCNAAHLFDFDQVEEAVEFAADKNRHANVYIAAALRLPDTDRKKRSNASDFYVATAVPIDIDSDYDATRARMASICDDGLVVGTGLLPDRRSHHWARLSEPCDDEATFGTAFRALVSHSGADMKVKDSARIMRLGGTVSYPSDQKKAKGYLTELTTVNIRDNAKPTDVQYLTDMAEADPALIYEGHATPATRPAGTGEIERDWTGRVINGREAHFRNILLRSLREFQLAYGGDPEPQDLFEAAFAIFTKPSETNNEDQRWTSEQGQAELMKRTANTIRRLRSGYLAKMGLYSYDTGVNQDLAERVAAEKEADRTPAPATMTEYRESISAETTTGPKPAGLISATPYQWIEASAIPPRDVLYGKHYYRQFLSTTVSPGGLGKSSNAVVEALAMVTNRDLLDEQPQKPLSVWYWNGEDPMEELQRRVAAACIHYKIARDDLDGRFYVDSGRNTEIVIAKEDRGNIVIAFPLVEALTAEIKARGIDVLIIDPFVASHSVSENDNNKIEAVVKQWMRVADEARCSIELIHHVRKGNGTNETTVEDARGAIALIAKVRSARVLNGMSKSEAQDIGVEEKERFGFFKMETGKANLAPRSGMAVWRRMVGVPLGNRVDALEDTVGVPVAWVKPDVLEVLKDHHRVAAVRMVQSGEWREDIRASNWVGHAVAAAMELDLDNPKDKHTVKSVVRLWCKTGVFQVIQQPDQQRKMKAFIIAPDLEG